MRKLLGVIIILLGNYVHSQDTMIVYFHDKGANPKTIQFTEKATERRIKNDVKSDSRDFAVSNDYLELLSSKGRILNVSRWMNAVSFVTSSSETDIEEFGFVKKAHIVRATKQPAYKNPDNLIVQKSVDYGIADTQVVIMNLDCIHDMGYTGQGVLIAVIDAGFKGMDTISYFTNLYNENRIVDMHDFLTSGSNVYQYAGHGTSVSSCMVGEKSGTDAYGGTAIDASLALYVAEDVSSETPIEELNVVAALERADSVGADVVNISLGYKTFDNPADDHPYSDMDGVTTIAAQGVNVAGSKGIMVVVSAGNDGPNTISTPCDADSALCVGATNKDGLYTFFSSIGPAFDGEIKPNVAAVGRRAWVILEDGQLAMANGTSFASPITAGGVACLLSATPAATVDELFAAIQTTASQAATPDEFLGYGIPDFCAAHATIPGASLTELELSQISIYPVPAKEVLYLNGVNSADDKLYIEIIDNSGKNAASYEKETASAIELDITSLKAGNYIVKVSGNTFRSINKLIVLPN